MLEDRGLGIGVLSDESWLLFDDDDDDDDLLFFLHPPPTGTFLKVPPLVQYLLHDLQKYLG